jgi:hypothetical protein
MPSKPPLLPAEIVRRMLRVARFDGAGILVVAGGFALASAVLHDVPGTSISLLVAGAGAVELHGAGLIRHGAERGLRWLVTSQVYLMTVMLGYVGHALRHVDVAGFKHLLQSVAAAMSLPTEDYRQVVIQAGMSVDDFLHSAYVSFFGLVALITVLYQGSMAVYYARRRTAVAAALRGD